MMGYFYNRKIEQQNMATLIEMYWREILCCLKINGLNYFNNN